MSAAKPSEAAQVARILPYGMTNAISAYDVQDKVRNIRQIASYYLCKTQSMFTYTGLPETIEARILELYLQINGHCAFLKHDGNYYVIQGSFGGELNYNYMPKQYTTVNPYLPSLSPLHEIGVNCIVIPNDSLYIGLSPMLSKFATEMVETDLSMQMALINSRFSFVLSAPDDNTEKSAKKFLDSILKGELGVIRDNAFLDGITVNPIAKASAHTAIQELDEHRQYIKGMFYHDIGLDSAFNMKRERINTAETEMTKDTLFPFVDDMLTRRKEAVEAINALFGLSITVEFNSSWKDEQTERELELEAMETDDETGTIDTEGPDDDKGGG